MPLKKLQLDGYSLTEILRLHFMRGQTINGDGGFDFETSSEFFQMNPNIVQMMSKRSVFDFSSGKSSSHSGIWDFIETYMMKQFHTVLKHNFNGVNEFVRVMLCHLTVHQPLLELLWNVRCNPLSCNALGLMVKVQVGGDWSKANVFILILSLLHFMHNETVMYVGLLVVVQ